MNTISFVNGIFLFLVKSFTLFLERLKYPKQYVRKREDNYTHKAVESFGFKTTPLTRPIIIAELVKVCREDISVIHDSETLNEMLLRL